jgi:hypothetical protein
VLDFRREALEPKNTKVTMRLARARRAHVALRFAVQRAHAPAFSSWLSASLPSTVSPCLVLIPLIIFLLLFSDFAHHVLVVGI